MATDGYDSATGNKNVFFHFFTRPLAFYFDQVSFQTDGF